MSFYTVSPKSIQNLRHLERVFFDLRRQIEFTNFLFNPINLRDEQLKFWQKYDEGKVYNPVYEYRELPISQIKAIIKFKNQIHTLMSETRKLEPNPLTEAFLAILSEENDAISLLCVKRDEKFGENLKTLYGLPSPKTLNKAHKILNSYVPRNNNAGETISSSDFAVKVANELKNRKLEWRVLEVDGLGAQFSVVPLRKEVKIRAGNTFFEKQFDRFVIHEVETHIFRAENGNIQPLEMFSFGLQNYLSTEEGLALLMEEKNNILSHDNFRLYAGRALAASLVDESFYDIINTLLKYFDRDEAYVICHRIKRGLVDTKQQGGFTKDYLYLHGHTLIKEYIANKGQLEKLFIGKINLNHAQSMWSLVEEGVLKKPKRLPKIIDNKF